eukprot:NODE_16_length_49026_cov_1.035992.p32 type:complete len:103 gc:universal NODE_16_length_49026_cov_1.035992:14768-15076(+)
MVQNMSNFNFTSITQNSTAYRLYTSNTKNSTKITDKPTTTVYTRFVNVTQTTEPATKTTTTTTTTTADSFNTVRPLARAPSDSCISKVNFWLFILLLLVNKL